MGSAAHRATVDSLCDEHRQRETFPDKTASGRIDSRSVLPFLPLENFGSRRGWLSRLFYPGIRIRPWFRSRLRRRCRNTLSNVRYNLQVESGLFILKLLRFVGGGYPTAVSDRERVSMQGTMMNYPLTLTHILERAGRIFPEQEIVSRLPDHSLHRCTYGDIYRRARRLAEALQKAGLRRGDRVATLMWNHYAHVEAYLGIPVSGGVMHTLNLRLAPREIAYIANHAGDRFLIVDDSLLPLYEQIREPTRFERVFVAALNKNAPPDGAENYDDLLATANGDFTYPFLDENEAASLCYTSGTTGLPKGVAYTHRSVFLHTILLTTADNFAIRHSDVVAPVVSMFHVNGWGFPYAAAMVGCKLVLPGPYLDPESLLGLFEKEDITAAAGVPTIWLNIVDCLEKHPSRWKLPRMRVIVGGAPLALELIRKLERYGLKVQQGGGLTESSPQATTNQLKAHMEGWPTERKQEVESKAGIPAPLVD